MTRDALRIDNHFVARGYLKRWANHQGCVWTYRLLVEHANVREWHPYATTALAHHQHLYTKMVAGQESDEIERWLDREIESPAENALQRATTDRQLRRSELHKLLRYVAAQQVRTPAFFVRRYPFFKSVVRDSMAETRRELEALVKKGEGLPPPGVIAVEPLPLKVTYLPGEQGDGSKVIHVSVPVGRSFWLWVMKQALDSTWHALQAHQWLILKAPCGFSWCTTDDPVVMLPPKSAQGDGGWNLPGCEILFPLGPSHLLYARVGGNARFTTRVSAEQAASIQRTIVTHAYRTIFANRPDSDVPEIRPRIASREQYQADQDQWRTWHSAQSASELAFAGDESS